MASQCTRYGNSIGRNDSAFNYISSVDKFGIDRGSTIDDDDSEDDISQWWLPSQVSGISYLFRYCDYNGLPDDLNFQQTTNKKQIELGLRVFNVARRECYPYFLYTYYYDKDSTVAYAELLPWISNVDEVLAANPVLRASIYLQICQALKWAADRGIYGMSGLKLLLVDEDTIVNLPDINIRSFGYIPFFTDYTECFMINDNGQGSTLLLDAMRLYSVDSSLESKLTVELSDKYISGSGFNRQYKLLYPVQTSTSDDNCARFRYMIKSYLSRLQQLYDCYVSINRPSVATATGYAPVVSGSGSVFWSLILVAVMKEYVIMIRSIADHCFTDADIVLISKDKMLDSIVNLPVPQVSPNYQAATTTWLSQLWLVLTLTLTRLPASITISRVYATTAT